MLRLPQHRRRAKRPARWYEGFRKSPKGFTLIELLITVTIISILSGFAISSYQGYLKETRLHVAKLNAQSVSVFLEDYYVHHATYSVGDDDAYTKAELNHYFGWQPHGDNNQYTYTVTHQKQTWDIVIEHISGHWLRCEQRIQYCCDMDTVGANKLACFTDSE